MSNEIKEPTQINSLQDLFGPVIYGYSRGEALIDGVLHDLNEAYPETASRYFKMPMAASASVVSLISQQVAHEGSSFEGILEDILNLFNMKAKISNSDRLSMKYPFTDANGKHVETLLLLCGPGDDLEPVLTLCLPCDD